MKIAVVDDEKYWRTKAAEKIRAFYRFPVEICEYASGVEFLEADMQIAQLEQEPFDIVFLDVEMDGGVDGFETTIQFKNRHRDTPVILLTAHGEFSRRGYRVQAFRYLEKQYLDELDEALQSIGIINPEDRWIEMVLADGTIRPVRTVDICYIEAAAHGSVVTLAGERVRSAMSLQKLERLLEEDTAFYRCHQAFIVNWKYMKEIVDMDVHAADEEIIPVSRRRLREAHSRFVQYHFKRASR